MECARCKEKREYRREELITADVGPKHDLIKLCHDHYMELADIENSFDRQKDEVIKKWLNK